MEEFVDALHAEVQNDPFPRAVFEHLDPIVVGGGHVVRLGRRGADGAGGGSPYTFDGGAFPARGGGLGGTTYSGGFGFGVWSQWRATQAASTSPSKISHVISPADVGKDWSGLNHRPT